MNDSSSSVGNGEDMHHRSPFYQQNQNCRENRPPMYNAEDYVAGLKRFCKLTGLQLYLNSNVITNGNGGEQQFNGGMGNGSADSSNNMCQQNGDYGGNAKNGDVNGSGGGIMVTTNNKKNKKQKNQNSSQLQNTSSSNNGNGCESGHLNVNGNFNGSVDHLALAGNGDGDMVIISVS